MTFKFKDSSQNRKFKKNCIILKTCQEKEKKKCKSVIRKTHFCCLINYEFSYFLLFFFKTTICFDVWTEGWSKETV